jgi:hypothetical protein
MNQFLKNNPVKRLRESRAVKFVFFLNASGTGGAEKCGLQRRNGIGFR